MQTDRELLELAASAAGYEIVRVFSDGRLVVDVGQEVKRGWDPLVDDGDRLRLARDLKITLNFADCCVSKRQPDGQLIQEFWDGDSGGEAHAVLRLAAKLRSRA